MSYSHGHHCQYHHHLSNTLRSSAELRGEVARAGEMVMIPVKSAEVRKNPIPRHSTNSANTAAQRTRSGSGGTPAARRRGWSPARRAAPRGARSEVGWAARRPPEGLEAQPASPEAQRHLDPPHQRHRAVEPHLPPALRDVEADVVRDLEEGVEDIRPSVPLPSTCYGSHGSGPIPEHIPGDREGFGGGRPPTCNGGHGGSQPARAASARHARARPRRALIEGEQGDPPPVDPLRDGRPAGGLPLLARPRRRRALE
eukprot:gene10437-biopygen6786